MRQVKKVVSGLFVQSRVKEKLKDEGVRLASDAIDALEALAHQELEKAAARAKANARKTVQAHDILPGD